MRTILCVLTGLFLFIILILMEYVIVQKKKIYRTFVDHTSKIASGGFSNYDGHWFAKDIGLDNLMKKNPEDDWLQKTGKAIKTCQIILLCMFAFVIITGIVGKIFGWV